MTRTGRSSAPTGPTRISCRTSPTSSCDRPTTLRS